MIKLTQKIVAFLLQ